MQLQSTQDGDRGPETAEDQVEEDGGGGGSFELAVARERTTILAKSGVPRGCDRRIFAATRLQALPNTGSRRSIRVPSHPTPPHRPRAVSHSAMAPPTKASGSKAKSSGGKKEKVFHPQSRKAGQLVRTQLRKSKLVDLARERHKKQGTQGTPIIHLLFLCLSPQTLISLRVQSASTGSSSTHFRPRAASSRSTSCTMSYATSGSRVTTTRSRRSVRRGARAAQRARRSRSLRSSSCARRSSTAPAWVSLPLYISYHCPEISTHLWMVQR